jgi:Straboviridae/Ackermannviridae/Kyanoviridae exonuclease subunit 1
VKLAIISDTQYGSRQDYIPFLELNKKFFRNVFFPELEKRGIKVIVHLGDLLERRRYVNYLTAKYLKEDFFDPILAGSFHLHWIFGNHDIFYRETAEVNSADVLAPLGIHKYSRPIDVEFDGCPILFLPWITKENYDHTLHLIRQSPASVAFGHLELQGFQLDQFQVSKTGLSSELLDRFELVLTGHYHHRSIKRNVYYVGSHAEFTWSDYGDKHGFHIFDTDTRDVEFIENPYTIFQKVFFDGTNLLPDPSVCSGKIVKVVVQAKNNPDAYSAFIQQVEEAQPLDITTVDNYLNPNLTDENVVSDTKDTLTIICEYIDSVSDVQVNKEKLKEFIVSLYKQAQDTE